MASLQTARQNLWLGPDSAPCHIMPEGLARLHLQRLVRVGGTCTLGSWHCWWCLCTALQPLLECIRPHSASIVQEHAAHEAAGPTTDFSREDHSSLQQLLFCLLAVHLGGLSGVKLQGL